VFETQPPEPKDGHWMGYYIEVKFGSDEDFGYLSKIKARFTEIFNGKEYGS